MSTTPKPLLAFYGATGGTVLATITAALDAGYSCTALARTPSKLTTLLLERGIPESTLSTHLYITQGDIRDPVAVAKPLSHNTRRAEIIVSGIGAVQLSELLSPTFDICAVAATNIIGALKMLEKEEKEKDNKAPPVSSDSAGDEKTPQQQPANRKPLLIAISTTGITTTGKRDVPLLFAPLYHILLAKPHHDKRNQEKIIVSEFEKKGAEESAIGGFVIPRPSLLMNGPGLGMGKVRVGEEEHPAVGYTIRREDVGRWIFEELVVPGFKGGWCGGKPSLSY